MKKQVKAMVSELDAIISQNKLFLGAIRYIGSNVWVFFYYFIDNDSVTSIDLVLFDIAEEANRRPEIRDPADLHTVLSIMLSDKGIYGRKTATIKFKEESEGVVEYKIYFSDASFYVKSSHIHKQQ